MTVEEMIVGAFEEATTEALEDRRLRRLISGQMTREELRKFFRRFIVTHLNSVQILSLLLSLAPRDAASLVRRIYWKRWGWWRARRPILRCSWILHRV